MEILQIVGTKYTPQIYFDSERNLLEIKGKSYPENTADFYSPIFSWLDRYLGKVKNEQVTVNMELVYFNSSSSKMLLDFFDMLEIKADGGADIVVNWIYEKEDDDTLEFGEEFREDYSSLKFNMVERNY